MTVNSDNIVQTENRAPVFVTFFAWWRPDIPAELSYRYWRDVHGIWASRTPGFYQYRQLHLGRIDADVLSGLGGVEVDLPVADQPNGIAHIAYKSRWNFRLLRLPFALKQAAMDDGYYVARNTLQEAVLPASRTLVDRVRHPVSGGPPNTPRFVLALRRKSEANVQRFRAGLERLVVVWSESDHVNRLRLEVLKPYVEPESKAEAGGVSHAWDEDKRYDAWIDVQLAMDTELITLFVVSECDLGDIAAIHAFPVNASYTLVYNGKPTLMGLRGHVAVSAIAALGAEFQKSDSVLRFTYGSVVGGATLLGTNVYLSAVIAALLVVVLVILGWS